MTHVKSFRNGHGFTLVELMITLVIASVIVAAVYAAYKSQRDTFEAQDQVTEIQQNLRNAMWNMTRTIRMAGYDPEGTGQYKITWQEGGTAVTKADSFRFDADMQKNGGAPAAGGSPTEKLYFALYKPGGVAADYPFSLQGTPGGSALAEYIDAIEFYYTYSAPPGAVPSTNPGSQFNAEHIKAVTISILGRARLADSNFTNNMAYVPASGNAAWFPAKNDHYRRQLLTTTVYIRNQGLQP